MFNFKRLIDKYSKTKPSLKTMSEGYTDYDNGGQWVDGEVTYKPFKGAVLPLGEDLIYDNSGYTTEDRKLYTYADVANNQIVSFKDIDYTVMKYIGYEEYDPDLKTFILKRGAKE